MKRKICTVILNRNLPDATDKLCDHLQKYCAESSDIYVVEAGSDKNRLSKYCTWWVKSKEVKTYGLRAPRGFIYGLSKLYIEGKFKTYDYFFLLCNDTEFEDVPLLDILLEEMSLHPRLGILSPCSRRWGECKLLNEK